MGRIVVYALFAAVIVTGSVFGPSRWVSIGPEGKEFPWTL